MLSEVRTSGLLFLGEGKTMLDTLSKLSSLIFTENLALDDESFVCCCAQSHGRGYLRIVAVYL